MGTLESRAETGKPVGSLADLRDSRNLSATLVFERTVYVVMSIAYGDYGSGFFFLFLQGEQDSHGID